MILGVIGSGTAHASLVEFASFNGNVALSTDGFGSTSNIGIISASAPSGSTVVAAYLYTATQNTSSVPTGLTLSNVAVDYMNSTPNETACCSLSSHRADVTRIVSAAIDGGPGGVYDFEVNEGTFGSSIDGSALVVVYSNPSLPQASVGLLDGFASVTGDTTSINFSDPLNPDEDGFFAEMVLGINFSCCSQRSTVQVNGNLLTENAGNFDDGAVQANGSLITVGGFDDPFSPMLPSYGDDTEKYDLSSYVMQGDTSITIDTFNASRDDNIFLAGFYVSGLAGFNAPPPVVTPPDDPVPPPTVVVPLPAGGLLLLGGLMALATGCRRRS